jgi:hypothetical protein
VLLLLVLLLHECCVSLANAQHIQDELLKKTTALLCKSGGVPSASAAAASAALVCQKGYLTSLDQTHAPNTQVTQAQNPLPNSNCYKTLKGKP